MTHMQMFNADTVNPPKPPGLPSDGLDASTGKPSSGITDWAAWRQRIIEGSERSVGVQVRLWGTLLTNIELVLLQLRRLDQRLARVEAQLEPSPSPAKGPWWRWWHRGNRK